ncbi:MAG: Ig-like domain-containing protein, partial [Burkholderiaceae bacterium]
SDLAGNESLAASGLDITVDTLIPETPTAPDLAAADDTGASNTDNITFTTKGLTFSGTVPLSKNASTVSLFIDKTTEGVLGAFDVTEEVIGTGAVDQMTGMWSIDTNLTEGTYVIRSFATDVAGNQSAASVDGVPVNVVVDTTAPLAPTNLDLDAADDSGSSPTDNITKVNQDLTITGSGVIGATVELYETIGSGTALVGSGVVNASGIFSIEVAPLGMLSVVADGVHTYTAVQYDTAGNKSLSSSPALAITIDTKGPNVSYDSSYYNAATNTLTLQGQGFKEITLSTVDVTAVSIDTNDDATDEVTLAASGTVVAIVDDRTLTVTLNNANAAAFEASKDFGNLGFLNNELNPLDLLDITFKFAGTDVAGNTSTGATTDLGILGAQNDTGIQRDYLVDLSAASGAVDETFGDNVAQIDFTTVNTLRFEGVSAAQLSVSANKMDGFNVSDTSVLGEGTSNAVDIINTGGAPSFAGLGLTFVDGSQFQDNTGGASTTLRSGSGNDQLLAGNAGDRLLGNAGNDLLVGGNGSDSIYGGSGDDILFGDSGNDYLSGGSGSDSFLFTGFDGHDVITGFGSTDVIHTLGFESVGSAEDLRALAVQSGADTLLVLGEGDNSVRLLGTIAANLTAANFAVDSFYVLRGDFVSGF